MLKIPISQIEYLTNTLFNQAAILSHRSITSNENTNSQIDIFYSLDLWWSYNNINICVLEIEPKYRQPYEMNSIYLYLLDLESLEFLDFISLGNDNSCITSLSISNDNSDDIVLHVISMNTPKYDIPVRLKEDNTYYFDYKLKPSKQQIKDIGFINV